MTPHLFGWPPETPPDEPPESSPAMNIPAVDQDPPREIPSRSRGREFIESITETGATTMAIPAYTTHPLAANRKYGWKHVEGPLKHPRYKVPDFHRNAVNLPASVDLTPECPAVYDQTTLGSCTANALAGLFQFLQMKLGLPSWVPSRLFIYYNERAIEGTISEDSGADGDDGMTSLAKKGVPPESLWPYDVDKFAENPPPSVWGAAYPHRLADPVSIDNTDIVEVKSCLASGYPIAFGFTAYAELESQSVAVSGVLPMPKKHEESIGGHEVLMVGYDDMKQAFKVRNSWGPGWGLAGYFWMPYDYATDKDLADDFRSARMVETL